MSGFRPIDKIEINDGNQIKTISLYVGDLSHIPDEHAVDLLVISAFPDDYSPTPTSLIGALDRVNLSVATLARSKLVDLRPLSSFWLSAPLSSKTTNIRQVACFEPPSLADPTTVVGNLFRGLMTFLRDDSPAVVAMPLLGSGDRGRSEDVMFLAVLDAAAHWMARGAAITELKIVLHRDTSAMKLAKVMKDFWTAKGRSVDVHAPSARQDIFLSFSSRDAEAAQATKQALLSRPDVTSVFDFRISIAPSLAWQSEIDAAITAAKKIVALISPDYLRSPECQEELHQGRLRHKREGGGVLYPIYWRQWDGDLALWLQLINAIDCREADISKLAQAARKIS